MDLYERNTCSFIVKVWIEPNDEAVAQPLWRGQITHVFTGQRQSFDNLATITDFIATYLAGMGAGVAQTEPQTRNSSLRTKRE